MKKKIYLYTLYSQYRSTLELRESKDASAANKIIRLIYVPRLLRRRYYTVTDDNNFFVMKIHLTASIGGMNRAMAVTDLRIRVVCHDSQAQSANNALIVPLDQARGKV